MGFLLKKMIGAWLMPFPLFLSCLVVGFIFLMFKLRRMSIFFVGLSLLGLFCFSNTVVSFYLLEHLESQYPPLIHVPASVDNIVVLAGSGGGHASLPANQTMSAVTISRLVEGLRLFHLGMKANPNMKVILSGGARPGLLPAARAMRQTAILLGVSPQHLKIEDGSYDTEDEARILSPILGKKSFILVTSAVHMPRAMKLFEHYGMHPIPAPSDRSVDDVSMPKLVPAAINLQRSKMAMHEYLGLLWLKLKSLFWPIKPL